MQSMPSQELVVAGDAVEDELDGEGGEDDAHYACRDMHATFTHQADQARA